MITKGELYVYTDDGEVCERVLGQLSWRIRRVR
jgi:hypothetical protein